MKIDFDGLQAFVAIAEYGGFSKAARELHITQTALTRRIQKLEGYLNLRLLERTTRQVQLTAVGREFLPQARAIVQQTSHAVERLKDVSQRALGNVTLACIPTMTSHVLPRILQQYVQLHPENRILLVDGSSGEVREAVLSGQAELGIALEGAKHPELVETALLTDPLVFICQQGHALARKRSVSWAEVASAELVGVSSFAATREVMDYRLAERGIRLRAKYEVQHHATALNFVAAGVGSAVLPASTFRDGDRPGLRKISIAGPPVHRKVVLLRRRAGTLSPAVEAFRSLVRSFPMTD
jgi:DNA-binding transcriptional LysR family regulator